MKQKYSEAAIRELYRIDNKYWKTGDVDILAARMNAAKRISERFYAEVGGIVSIATRTGKPLKTVIDALEVLGFEMEGEDETD